MALKGPSLKPEIQRGNQLNGSEKANALGFWPHT